MDKVAIVKLISDMIDSEQNMGSSSVTADLMEDIEQMITRKQIIKKHPYSIFFLEEKKCWRTTIVQAGKRKWIQASTRERLEDKLVSFYKKEEECKGSSESHTLEDYYRLYRRAHDVSVTPGSVRKYDTDYTRFFQGQDIMKKDVRKITADDLRYFIGSRIKALSLSPSPAKTMTEYLKRSFRAAVEAGTIARNPMDGISWTDYKSVISERPRKDVRAQTMEQTELIQLMEKLREGQENGYASAFAVEFAALTGVRVGEVVAIKKEKVKADVILIDASMKRDVTAEHCTYFYSTTKNGKIRELPITGAIRDLLDRLQQVTGSIESDFLFCLPDGEPIPNHQVSSWIKNKCRQLGIQTYGIHALRKTVNSAMARAGVPSVTRAALLGHSIAVNEKYYTYDTTDNEARKEALEKVPRLF